jgi:hypothetical protein
VKSYKIGLYLLSFLPTLSDLAPAVARVGRRAPLNCFGLLFFCLNAIQNKRSNVSSKNRWCRLKIRITSLSKNICGYISIQFAISNENKYDANK